MKKFIYINGLLSALPNGHIDELVPQEINSCGFDISFLEVCGNITPNGFEAQYISKCEFASRHYFIMPATLLYTLGFTCPMTRTIFEDENFWCILGMEKKEGFLYYEYKELHKTLKIKKEESTQMPKGLGNWFVPNEIDLSKYNNCIGMQVCGLFLRKKKNTLFVPKVAYIYTEKKDVITVHGFWGKQLTDFGFKLPEFSDR